MIRRPACVAWTGAARCVQPDSNAMREPINVPMFAPVPAGVPAGQLRPTDALRAAASRPLPSARAGNARRIGRAAVRARCRPPRSRTMDGRAPTTGGGAGGYPAGRRASRVPRPPATSHQPPNPVAEAGQEVRPQLQAVCRRSCVTPADAGGGRARNGDLPGPGSQAYRRPQLRRRCALGPPDATGLGRLDWRGTSPTGLRLAQRPLLADAGQAQETGHDRSAQAERCCRWPAR